MRPGVHSAPTARRTSTGGDPTDHPLPPLPAWAERRVSLHQQQLRRIGTFSTDAGTVPAVSDSSPTNRAGSWVPSPPVSDTIALSLRRPPVAPASTPASAAGPRPETAAPSGAGVPPVRPAAPHSAPPAQTSARRPPRAGENGTRSGALSSSRSPPRDMRCRAAKNVYVVAVCTGGSPSPCPSPIHSGANSPGHDDAFWAEDCVTEDGMTGSEPEDADLGGEVRSPRILRLRTHRFLGPAEEERAQPLCASYSFEVPPGHTQTQSMPPRAASEATEADFFVQQPSTIMPVSPTMASQMDTMRRQSVHTASIDPATPSGQQRTLHPTRANSSRPDLGLLAALTAGVDETLYILRHGAIERCRVDMIPGTQPPRLPHMDPTRADMLRPSPGTAAPYLTWENTTTHADRRERPQIRLSPEGISAEPAHLSTQGTVVGAVAFSSGIHQWRVQVGDICGVSFGIVSRVGVDSFTACRRGELPPYVACLRPGWRLEHRLHWCDGAGQAHWCELEPPLAQHMHGRGDELSAVIDFVHHRILFLANDVVVALVDCVRRAAAASPSDIAALLGSTGAQQATPRVAPRAASSQLLGDHTVFCHVQYGASVSLTRRVQRRVRPLVYSDQEAQRTDPPRLLCGNPYARWALRDGMGVEATFRLPMCMCHFKGSLWVTDCDTIREVSLPDGQVTTHRLQLHPPDCQPAIEFLGAIHGYIKHRDEWFFVTDLTNGTILQVSPTTWQARPVFNRGQYGFRPNPDSRRRRLSRVIKEMIVYDQAAALTCDSVEQVVAQSCCATFRGISSLDLPAHAFGVHGLAHLPGGHFFISDTERHCILCCDLQADTHRRNEPSVCSGHPGAPGSSTGLGDDVRFRNPTRLVADADADVLYVSDTGNQRTCKITLHYGGVRGKFTTQVDEVCHLTTDREGKEIALPGLQGFGLALQAGSLLVAEPRTDSIWQVTLREGARGAGTSFLAPVEQLMSLLRQSRSQAEAMPVRNAEHIRTLELAHEILTSTPNIYEMQYVGGAMDEDVARYLTEEYAPGKGAMSVFDLDAEEDEEGSEEEEEEEEDQGTEDGASARKPQIRFGELGTAKALGVDIGDVDSIDFDVFKAVAACDEQQEGVILHVAYNIMARYPFFTRYFPDSQSQRKLITFLMKVQNGYRRDNPYHNHIHAADVTQTTHWMINKSDLVRGMSDVDCFAILVASVIHDYDHPGVTNQFLVSTQDELALEFNDQSVLENHHLQHGLRLMKLDSCDILVHLRDDERKQFRDMVITHVLGTDMKGHFTTVGTLRTRLGENMKEKDDPVQILASEDKMLILKSILHAADISNPAKNRMLAEQWTDRVMREFRAQGKQEEERKLPVSMFMGPDADRANCQKGFIEYIVLPLFSVLAGAFVGLKPQLDNVEANLQYWREYEQPARPAGAGRRASMRKPPGSGTHHKPPKGRKHDKH
eukprot:TRINITY_DN14777_c0_g1_i2.p1 TRINITY_DN14777_c0_g1~~TRINITY_DN14777_c0_g1_i2.p1  ORF type:complete len:1485 (+),score=417.56 TRINITY_DN14777_c0_g1_i2:135-4457(+)